jgi:hypothetical protein
MNNYIVQNPIAFIIFNRPDNTKIVFNQIKSVKPSKLFIIADGPRENFFEKQKCIESLEILKQIDWECNLYTNISEYNLGCKLRLSSGINWVFQQVDKAIFLEDDCVPNTTFFRYMDFLLDYYKDNKDIMLISGNNFLLGKKNITDSYFFSKYHFIWGWGSWKRVWDHYDVNISDYPLLKSKNFLTNYFSNTREIKFWYNILDLVYDNKIDTWDYQLGYLIWKSRGLVICPKYNLVSNIGFDENATHTKEKRKISNLHTKNLEFPISHPKEIIFDYKADQIAFKHFFEWGKKSIFFRIHRKIKSIIDARKN